MAIDVGDKSNVYPMVPYGEYRMFHRKNPTGPLNFGSTEEHVVRRIGSRPAMVPPGEARRLSPGGKTFDGWVDNGHEAWMTAIWRNVETKLREADEIVVIGYSLPETDPKVIETFQRCLSTRPETGAKRICLINKNAEIARRYRQILRIPVEWIGGDFKEVDLTTL